MRNSKFALFSLFVSTIIMMWIAGADGLGPLDDHMFLRTIFQGERFGFNISPEIGRFFPLTGQEFVLASILFWPSAKIFYLINSIKALAIGGILFLCLTFTRLSTISLGILYLVLMFSLGIPNTLFRFQAGELNILFLMLVYSWSALNLNITAATFNKKIIFLILGIFSFSASLFYKELSFIFGLIFSLSEIARAYFSKKDRPSKFIYATFILSLTYIIFYLIWSLMFAGGRSYAAMHAFSFGEMIALYTSNDPFLIFIVLPLTTFRAYVIVRRREIFSIYDSFLLAASAYVCAFLVLSMFNTYYLLPAYAFAIIGISGVLENTLDKVKRSIILILAFCFTLNTLPIFISDIYSQRLISSNHSKFAGFLSNWLLENPPLNDPQKIVLVGVSPGNGVEIIESLKIFLSTSGVPSKSFSVIPTEPIDNYVISDFYGLKNTNYSEEKVGDLLVFNPYQQRRDIPSMQVPSLKEIFQSETSWAIPRLTVLNWINLCYLQLPDCDLQKAGYSRYIGYRVQQVVREKKGNLILQPLKSTDYRLTRVNFPAKMKANNKYRVDVLIQNVGKEDWPANGSTSTEMAVNLSYRFFNDQNQMILEGSRVPFAEPIKPNDFTKLSIIINTPALPGKYELRIGPVQEGVLWFDGLPGKFINII